MLRRSRQSRGMTLLELMIVIGIIAILTALAAPGLRKWSANAQMRTAAGTLQSTLRTAQNEAVRSFRQVVLFRTNDTTCSSSATAVSTGARWMIRTVPLMTGETTTVLQCGNMAEGSPTMSVSGPTAVCFSPTGRPVAVTSPGVGAGVSCGVGSSNRIIYAISSTASTIDTDLMKLQVWVTLGGNIRMCDSARLLSDTVPEGCPVINQSATS